MSKGRMLAAAWAAVCVIALGTSVALALPSASEHGNGRAGTAHATGAVKRAACGNFRFHWAEGPAFVHMWQTDWISNPDNCFQRGGLRCHNRSGQEHWFNGGWVQRDGLASGVNCDQQYPEPDQGNFDWSNNSDPNTGYFYECAWRAVGNC